MTDQPEILAPGTSETFVEAIRLTPVPQADDSIRRFEATPQYVPWPKAYGGDMVAQATRAMIQTTASDRILHSTHAYFMRPVDMHVPVQYDVEILRDGRGFSTRQVRAKQNGKTAFISIGSFQVPLKADDYQKKSPSSLAINPESLAEAGRILEENDTPSARYWSYGRSFDMRHVEQPVYLDKVRDGNTADKARQALWVRSFDRLPDEKTARETENLHRIGLAYVCDYTILETLLRVRDLSWSSEGLVTASLDHSMWFHRPGRVDDWILYVQEAISMQSNRGLALGHFFAKDGKLLATVAQEGLIRGSR